MATQGFCLDWNGEFSSVCWFAVHILHGRLLIKKRTQQISVLLYERTREKHNRSFGVVDNSARRLAGQSLEHHTLSHWYESTREKPRWESGDRTHLRKLPGISYRDHITNEEVKARIGNAIGPYEDLLTSVKRRKLKWYGHVTRSSGLPKTILQGTVQGGRQRRRQRKRWEDNIKE